jgi:hypothetical protein
MFVTRSNRLCNIHRDHTAGRPATDAATGPALLAARDATIDSMGRQAVTLADLRLVAVLQRQVERGQLAPALLPAAACVEERLASCAARAAWLHVAGQPWTQEQIAEHLNDHGQTTRRGRPWSQSAVSQLLRRTGADR